MELQSQENLFGENSSCILRWYHSHQQNNVDTKDGQRKPSLHVSYIRAHMNRGVILLQACVKSVSDVAALLPRSERELEPRLVEEEL